MAKEWIAITRDFDRSLSFTKVRWDFSKSWSDGYFSELPNINCDGEGWTSITGAEWGYAGQYTMNLYSKACYIRDRENDSYSLYNMNDICTQVPGTDLYEYEYSGPLYWGGFSSTDIYDGQGQNAIFVEVETSVFDIDPTEIAAESGASSYTISVSAETGVTWTASTNDSWISLAPTTGEGNGSITVSVAGAGYTARTGEITLTSSEGDSISVPVSQAKKPLILTRKDMYQGENLINKMYRNEELIYQRLIAPILSVSTSSFVLEATGGTDSFTVTANYPYTVSSDADWLTVEKDGYTCSFTATDNSAEGTVSRSATITVSSEGKTVEVSITQKGATIIYSAMPLTFEIISGGTIVWKASNTGETKTISYSKNDGEWTDITSTTEGAEVPVNAGDKVRFKGNNAAYGKNVYYNYFAGSTCVFNAYGNIMSLVNDTNYESYTTLTSENEELFVALFSGTSIVNAGNLILPATTLAYNCYSNMFRNCASLTTAPELPATDLRNYCYRSMFNGCTSLATAPALPALVAYDYCYSYMFKDTAITQAPALPATTISSGSYQYIFRGCTGLTSAPDLPAPTLVQYCYLGMFYGCTNLNYIKCLAISWGSSALTNWTNGVAASGTFVKDYRSNWATGVSGIPDGWTVVDAE